MKQKDLWSIIATFAGSGTLLFSTELAKIIPGPDDQIIAIGGTITALAGILLQIHSRTTEAQAKAIAEAAIAESKVPDTAPKPSEENKKP